MSRRPRKPVPRKITRNPLARVLATGRYKNRVVKRADAYRRRPKHRKDGDGEAE